MLYMCPWNSDLKQAFKTSTMNQISRWAHVPILITSSIYIYADYVLINSSLIGSYEKDDDDKEKGGGGPRYN